MVGSSRGLGGGVRVCAWFGLSAVRCCCGNTRFVRVVFPSDGEKKRQRQLGALAPTVMRSRIPLAEFMAEDWWPRYAIPNLADDTRRRYLEVRGKHLLPRLGDYELRAIT